jgi:hypothetical protein
LRFLTNTLTPYSETKTSRQATVEVIYRGDFSRPFQDVLILKSSERAPGVIGGRLASVCIMFLAILGLAASNAYFILSYQAAERQRTNALGLALLSAEGALGESIHILNSTVSGSCIDTELWDALQQDLIWQSRILPVIASLDVRHERHWMQIKDATISLERVVSNVKQTYAEMNIFLINLTDRQIAAIAAVRDILIQIEANAFPVQVIFGADPEVTISHESISKAADAAARLQSELSNIEQCLITRDDVQNQSMEGAASPMLSVVKVRVEWLSY